MPPPPWRASGIRPLTNGISERLNSVSPSDRCYVVQTARSPVVLTKTQWSPSAIYFRVVDRAEMFFKMFDFSNVRTGIHRCRRPIYTWRRSKSVTIWNVHNSADIFSPLTTVCHSAFFSGHWRKTKFGNVSKFLWFQSKKPTVGVSRATVNRGLLFLHFYSSLLWCGSQIRSASYRKRCQLTHL